MTISYVWPRVEKQNDDFNENQQIEAVTGHFFADLFKVLNVRQTEYQLLLEMLLKHLKAQFIFRNICLAL